MSERPGWYKESYEYGNGDHDWRWVRKYPCSFCSDGACLITKKDGKKILVCQTCHKEREVSSSDWTYMW